MPILDVKCLLDVERYRKINVHGKSPAEVYPDAGAMAPARILEFLQECARSIPVINFVERANGVVYARMESGRISWADPAGLAEALADDDTRAGLAALAPDGLPPAGAVSGEPRKLEPDRAHTVGQWATVPSHY